ncbi:MAG: prolyl oligopeptidase family serine peptidase [Candidatus Elarobacter sp.]
MIGSEHARRFRAICTAVVFVAGVAPSLGAATAPTPPKKLLDYHAYSAWRQIRDTRLSRDGRWLAYAQVPAEADGELVVRDLDAGKTYREARGRTPAFSADGRFVVYRITARVAEVKAADKTETPAEKRPQDGLGVLELGSGSATTVERVKSFALARDGMTLVYLIEPSPAPSGSPAASPSSTPLPSPAASSSPGTSPSPAPNAPDKAATTSLAIRRLGGDEPVPVANVASYAVSADGSRVAYIVQTTSEESLHVRDVAAATDRIVERGAAHLAAPALSSDGATLAYLRDPTAYAKDAPKKEAGARAPFHLIVADTRTGITVEAFGPAAAGISARTFATDAVAPEFSGDGRRLAFATAAVPTPRPSSAPARVDLDFWYWRDGELPTQQRHEAEDPRHGAYLALYDVAARRVAQLESATVPTVTLAKQGRYALGVSNAPYAKLVTFDDTYWDVYRIDVTNGARRLLLRRAKGDAPQLSPGGRYAAGYDPLRRAWYTLRMSDGRRAWITDPRTIRAAVEDDDHPAPPPAYGFGGWTPGDRAALVYDRYDIWSVSPDDERAPVALTRGAGRASQRIYRVMDPRTDQPEGVFNGPHPVFESAPYVLTVTDDRSKAEGFAALNGLAAQAPHTTMLLDRTIGRPLRARTTGRLVFTEQRFDVFPDLWTSGAMPSRATRVSDANPQAVAYAQGHARLIDYSNARGQRLRAVLVTPDGFDPHRRYPMLVYVYEKMSDDLHRYWPPASGTGVNLARYANHGYVVLEPDIRYRIGHTTASAVDCVSSAVRKVVAMGFVDPARIGMAGHSYGGYEVNALVTHTNIFRAVESGASDSDLPSLYGGFWESGDVQQSYYEHGQGRIGATPWGRPDLYVENSPLFFVDRVRAPYLRIQDDKDGFVPYGQGVEFFTALRRAGKEAYMFSFIGENHGLAKQANKDYWTVHLDEFFDHFLLGAPRPEWMSHNGSFEHRGERDVESLYTPSTVAP